MSSFISVIAIVDPLSYHECTLYSVSVIYISVPILKPIYISVPAVPISNPFLPKCPLPTQFYQYAHLTLIAHFDTHLFHLHQCAQTKPISTSVSIQLHISSSVPIFKPICTSVANHNPFLPVCPF